MNSTMNANTTDDTKTLADLEAEAAARLDAEDAAYWAANTPTVCFID